MNAQEACEALAINRATLYAYVSRGLIRSEPGASTSRERRYHADDVNALLKRKQHRRSPERTAQDALHWGIPVLESALTLIEDGRLSYRGHDMRELADSHPFEDVALLLWQGSFADDHGAFIRPLVVPPLAADAALDPIQRIQVLLTHAAATDYTAFDLTPPQTIYTGGRILRLATAALVRMRDEATIAGRLAGAWSADDPHIAGLINQALIAVADHELNASSFTARVIASADATLYAVVVGGLSALQGKKHGGSTEQAAALLRSIEQPGDARTALTERLKRGERIPGFGHALYSADDPRAALLFDGMRRAYSDSLEIARADAIIDAADELIQRRPNIDFALATLERAAHLPRRSGLALFALGRTAGLIAHAIEQYTSGTLIRPRAKYTGAIPLSDSD